MIEACLQLDVQHITFRGKFAVILRNWWIFLCFLLSLSLLGKIFERNASFVLHLCGGGSIQNDIIRSGYCNFSLADDFLLKDDFACKRDGQFDLVLSLQNRCLHLNQQSFLLKNIRIEALAASFVDIHKEATAGTQKAESHHQQLHDLHPHVLLNMNSIIPKLQLPLLGFVTVWARNPWESLSFWHVMKVL